MSKATIYGNPNSFNFQKALVAAKMGRRKFHIGSQLEAVNKNREEAIKFPAQFEVGLVDGTVHLFSETAIAAHFLGSSLTPETLQWLCFSEQKLNAEVKQLIHDAAQANADNKQVISVCEGFFQKLRDFKVRLAGQTFLVENKFSYADVACAFELLPAIRIILNTKLQLPHDVNRWLRAVLAQKEITLFKFFEPHPPYSQKHMTSDGLRRILATQDEEQQQEAPQEKFVDPLAALSAGSFNMDAWKRCYSSEDTATKAIPYLWENFDPTTHSIWMCDYKKPENLTLTSMSCELIAAMFQRLEKLRKYAFATVCLFGNDTSSTISGVWIWRGQDLVFPMSADWTIDYETFHWEPLRDTTDQTKKTVNDFLLGNSEGKTLNQKIIFH